MVRCPTWLICPHGKGLFTCVHRALLAAFIESGTETYGLNCSGLRLPMEKLVSGALGFDMSLEPSGYSSKHKILLLPSSQAYIQSISLFCNSIHSVNIPVFIQLCS